MADRSTQDINSIDAAIVDCERYITSNEIRANRALGFAVLLVAMTVSTLGFVAMRPTESNAEKAADALIAVSKLKAILATPEGGASVQHPPASDQRQISPSSTKAKGEEVQQAAEAAHATSGGTPLTVAPRNLVPPFNLTMDDISGIESARNSERPAIETGLITAAAAILSLVLALMVSIYRFHLKEISRTHHFKLGFRRVRIAANNTSEGFLGEVRTALTIDAFNFEDDRSTKKGRVENPLPGHPTSEITTAVINKILDAVDVIPKKVPE